MDLYKIPGAETTSTPSETNRDYWQALREDGYVELIREPSEGASLGYAVPVIEERNGRTVAVAYAIGTEQERQAENQRQWRESVFLSPFQARVALTEFGLLATVEALMANPSTPETMRLAWGHGQEFKRLSPFILEGAALLQLSEEKLDALFKYGESVQT